MRKDIPMSEERILSLNETDMSGYIRPSVLCALSMDCTMTATNADGASNQRLREEFGAVWMLARLRLRQFVPLNMDDSVTLQTAPRVIVGGGYLRCVDIRRNDEPVARCDMVFMVVSIKDRKIVRPRDIDKYWFNPPADNPSTELRRLHFRGDIEHVSDLQVRRYDCDANGHLTSRRYIDYVCECGGYWDGAPKLARELQVEYMNECHPGELISVDRVFQEDRQLLRGTKPDGRVAFCASCVLEDIG